MSSVRTGRLPGSSRCGVSRMPARVCPPGIPKNPWRSALSICTVHSQGGIRGLTRPAYAFGTLPVELGWS